MKQTTSTYDAPAVPGNNPAIMPELTPDVPATPGNRPNVMPEVTPNVPATPGNRPNVMPELPSDVPATPGNRPNVTPTLPSDVPATPGNNPNVMPELPSDLPATPGNRPNIMPTLPSFPGNWLPAQPQPAPGYCNIRILHAGVNQPAVNVTIDSQTAAQSLRYGNVTPYYYEPAGYKRITVTSSQFPRLVLTTAVLPFQNGDVSTVAIINSHKGVSLFQVLEPPCRQPDGQACLRMVGLSYNCPPANLLLSNGRMLFTNVRFQDITDYARVRPGSYRLLGTENIPCEQASAGVGVCYGRLNVLFTSAINLAPDQSYTLYLLGNAYGDPGLTPLLLESYLPF